MESTTHTHTLDVFILKLTLKKKNADYSLNFLANVVFLFLFAVLASHWTLIRQLKWRKKCQVAHT